MDVPRLEREIDLNYDAFRRGLGALLPEHRGEYALMRDQVVVQLYPSIREANVAAEAAYADGIFSIQEVMDEPMDLGFFSHVVG